MAVTLRTQCCVVGGGPAGMMLGLILARQDIEVIVLEKHGDFLRDYRGDTIHPSTLEILDDLGLAKAALGLNLTCSPVLTARTPDGPIVLADIRKVRTRYPFAAMVPQWDFLNFLAQQAARYSGFRLLMPAEAVDLVERDGIVTGVRYRTPAGEGEIQAALTVAADGRHSVIRDRSGLPLVNTAPPVDMLWFSIPRYRTDPEEAILFIGHGHSGACISREDYWQVAYTIPKGSASSLRQHGIAVLQDSFRQLVPELGDRIDSIRDWDQTNLLSVQANRLRRWYRRWLLCIGDAAHAMSPVGGVGINIAIQDAVVAANLLTEPIRRDRVTLRQLAAVQRSRAWQVRVMQRIQAKVLDSALFASRDKKSSLDLLIEEVGARLVRHPAFITLNSRLFGIGIRRVHVKPALRNVRAAETTPAVTQAL